MRCQRIWCRRSFCAAAVLAGIATTAGVREARAGFEIVKPTVWVDRTRQQAHFQLRFNRPPDFQTVDEFGRPMNSFQFFVNPDWSGDPGNLQLDYGPGRDVLRGDEIHLAGQIRIRDGMPSDTTGPEAGGWGPMVAAVPYQMEGTTLSFQVPWKEMREKGPAISWSVISTEAVCKPLPLQVLRCPCPRPPGPGWPP